MKWRPFFGVVAACSVLAAIYVIGGLRHRYLDDPHSTKARRVDSTGGADCVSFKEAAINLGSIVAGKTVTAKIDLKNELAQPISIENVNATCTCANASFEVPDKELAPKGWSSFSVTMSPKHGTETWPIRVLLSNGQQYEVQLYGKTYHDVRLSQDTWDFGTIEAGASAETQVILLGDAKASPRLMGEPESSSDILDVDYDSGGSSSGNRGNPGEKDSFSKLGVASIHIKGAPAGRVSEHVTFHLDLSGSPRTLTLLVRGLVRDEITISPDVLTFSKTKTVQHVVLASNGAQFTIEAVESSFADVTAEEVPSSSSKLGIATLKLSYTGASTENRVGYCRFRIKEMPSRTFDLPVRYTP